MTTARRSINVASVWDRVCSGVGYHLDNLGRWLIVNAPAIGSNYAAFWRRRATPEAAAGLGVCRGVLRAAPVVGLPAGRPVGGGAREGYRGAVHPAWHSGTTVDLTLGNDNSLCLYVCGSFEPNEFAFLIGC